MNLPLLTVPHDGGRMVDATLDQLTAAGVPADAILAAVRPVLKKQVDDEAEKLRLELITPGSGQAMEYQEVYNEAVQIANALAANAAADLDPTAFPMLAGSIGTNLDPKTERATVDVAGEARAALAAYDAYQKVGAAIRSARLKGKAAIDAAADVTAACEVAASIDWPPLP
ncbi:hypothetical protein SAMN02799622_00831 [Methylobacterium sp. UNC378MF]|uniref:hypothetical protein n=1 Tax=Methylobacterium sp. UNC378MF TaxID=1502748 RepID=UPI00088BD3BE|nr:hypothetical protein [Methylobacterium sp. UNC378MF]SDA12854.1 hypothetical protein SAMN02799622_00831 [Methylobacterium sp. UNC378MF]